MTVLAYIAGVALILALLAAVFVLDRRVSRSYDAGWDDREHAAWARSLNRPSPTPQTAGPCLTSPGQGTAPIERTQR